MAAFSGSIDGVKSLLSHPEILINEPNDYHSTALMLAAQQGHSGIVKLIMANKQFEILAYNQ